MSSHGFVVDLTADNEGLIIRCKRCDERKRLLTKNLDYPELETILNQANALLGPDAAVTDYQVLCVKAAIEKYAKVKA